MIRLKRTHLRQVIREVINTWHRNHQTIYDDPFGIEDHHEMDLDIQQHINPDGTWAVKIVCGWDDSFSEPLRVFKTKEDAGFYINSKSDAIYRAYINSGKV